MSIIRTATWNVDKNLEVLPDAPLYGGVQGEDNATEVVFQLSEDCPLRGADYQLRIEYVDATGAWDCTDTLGVVDGCISQVVPLAWTQHGGLSSVRLVAVKDGQVAYTLKGLLQFDGRETAARAEKNVVQMLVHTIIERLKQLKEDFFARVDSTLDETSINPVQNAVVAGTFHRMDDDLGDLEAEVRNLKNHKPDAYLNEDSENSVMNRVVAEEFAQVAQSMNDDRVIVAGLKKRVDAIKYDAQLDEASTNPPQNKVVAAALKNIQMTPGPAGADGKDGADGAPGDAGAGFFYAMVAVITTASTQYIASSNIAYTTLPPKVGDVVMGSNGYLAQITKIDDQRVTLLGLGVSLKGDKGDKGNSISVDNRLDPDSPNPVANRVICQALADIPGSTGGSDVFVVEYDGSGEVAPRFTSSIIREHVLNGNRAELHWDGIIYNLSACTGASAYFAAVFDDVLELVEVTDDQVYHYDWDIPTGERLQNMDITQEQRWNLDQQHTARQNIGAPSFGDLDNLSDNIADMEGTIGDVSDALDAIISMQAELRGETLISFVFDGGPDECSGTYFADDGMTWGEWCGSFYNVAGYYIDSDSLLTSPAGDRVLGPTSQGDQLEDRLSRIIAGGVYRNNY